MEAIDKWKRPLREVEITSNGIGQGKVVVDGKDLANVVKSVTVSLGAGEIPEVTLELIPDVVRLKGKGFEVRAYEGRDVEVDELLRPVPPT